MKINDFDIQKGRGEGEKDEWREYKAVTFNSFIYVWNMGRNKRNEKFLSEIIDELNPRGEDYYRQ